jgi:hypothetical protein
VLATDYYLQSVDVRQFVEKARLLIFQLYCRIHSRVKLECVSCVTVGDGRQLAFLPPPPPHTPHKRKLAPATQSDRAPCCTTPGLLIPSHIVLNAPSSRVVASMLNKDVAAAEKYIVGVIRDGHLDGRIDSLEGHLVINPPASKVYVWCLPLWSALPPSLLPRELSPPSLYLSLFPFPRSLAHRVMGLSLGGVPCSACVHVLSSPFSFPRSLAHRVVGLSLGGMPCSACVFLTFLLSCCCPWYRVKEISERSRDLLSRTTSLWHRQGSSSHAASSLPFKR